MYPPPSGNVIEPRGSSKNHVEKSTPPMVVSSAGAVPQRQATNAVAMRVKP